MFSSIDQVQEVMEMERYICDRELATVLFLALKLQKPLLLEGEAGVGKTDVAKVMTQAMKGRLIRLQCYEGLDATTTKSFSSAGPSWKLSRSGPKVDPLSF